MKKQIMVLCVTGCLAALAATSFGQWTETVYAITSPPAQDSETLNSFGANANQTYNWTVSAQSNFTVTGSSTQEPSWRTLFANLCDNHWWYSEDFSYTPTQNEIITNHISFETRNGTNSFTRSNPSGSASRILGEKLIEDAWFTHVPGDSEPPGD